MAVFWSTEVIPLGITSLIPIVLIPMFGIMTTEKVALQYMKDTTILFVGGLMVAIAIEEWNLHKRIALKVLLYVGVRPAWLIMGLMGVTAFLSMWISNTATTAMMVPIAQAVLDQLSLSEDRFDETSQEELQTKQSLNLLPDEIPVLKMFPGNSHKTACKTSDNEKATRERRNLYKLVTLCICYSASIGGTATLTGTGPNLVLEGQFNQLFPENGGVITFSSWFVYAFPNMLIMLFLCWIWLQIYFLGFNFKILWGCGSVKTWKEIAAYQVIKEEYKKLGKMSFAEILVLILFIFLVLLWFTRNPGFMPGWATVIFGKSKKYISDGTTVMFIALLMYILPSKRPRLESLFKDKSSTEQHIQGPSTLLDWEVVQHKLPWNVMLLLGGGFALAKSCEASGLSKWLGNQLNPLKTIPHWGIVIILCLLISIFTEFTSNTATATLFLPILASLAVKLKINPLYVMIPCTVTASFSFMLPVATPPNAIVFTYGHLTVMDMVKAGFVMNLVGVVCVTLSVNTWGWMFFNMDQFPAWANTTNL
ncbi:solute carrier family 13 member 5-like isoform X2 [Callorhinchus milii]|uniref:solute carrier family 13 member 5-like isoform X2 n=1 Tax=Callorhinchus milii TaxID=7868 RepID=UPI001C3F7FC4|nr:solute carrier family 13 member 5-like isoform X2 [Callorhinchus milii]